MCVTHVSSSGTFVEGHSCFCPCRSAFRCLSFRMCFSEVVFMVVGMCSYGGILCGFWWVRVDSDHFVPATRSFRCSSRCTSVCLWSFLMERQLARAAHLPCKTQNKSIASDAAFAGRSNVAASASGRISQRTMNKPIDKMCRHSARFKQMRTQMPRILLVPRVDVVRKCLLICFLAGTGHQDDTRPP